MKKTTRTELPHVATESRTPALTEAEAYSKHLDRDIEWAMDEGDRFFQGTSEAHNTLRRIAQRLSELGIDYMVVGSMAMFQHGYRCFTEVVELLVTLESLNEIHQRLVGLGYRPTFEGSKNLRDTENGVDIKILLTGAFPGDGKPNPDSFPAPSLVADEINGIRYIDLTSLIELKLAFGMTSSERRRDLADAIEMIKVLELPRDFADKLDPFVQDKYNELWDGVNLSAKRYVTFRRIDGADSSAKSTDELIVLLSTNDDSVRAMLADGVAVDRVPPIAGNEIRFVTSDPTVARRYDMHEESEFR